MKILGIFAGGAKELKSVMMIAASITADEKLCVYRVFMSKLCRKMMNSECLAAPHIFENFMKIRVCVQYLEYMRDQLSLQK